MKKLTSIRACLSDVIVIMVIMRAPLVEFLYQTVMEWIPTLEYLLPGARGACGHVLSCQANAIPSLGKIYSILEALGWSDWMPGPIPGRGGRRTRQTGGKILPAHGYRNEKERWCVLLPSSIFLGWWPLLFSQEWWGHIRYEVYGSPVGCCWREPIVSRILDRN
jgi:hypothetical protein